MKTLLALLISGWGIIATLPAAAQNTGPVTPCITRSTLENGHVHVVKVDLSCPSVSLVGTPRGSEATTVRNFAFRNRLNVAINASFFDPQFRPQGLVISDGELWEKSRDTHQHSFLACTRDNRCQIDPPNNMSRVDPAWNTVIAGWQNLQDGRFVCARSASASCYSNARGLYPRSSVGLSPDRRWLYIVVAEGRLNDFLGYSLTQLARVYRSLGVRDALNLDGGGSTTLVINNKRINDLPPRQLFLERSVANQFGVRDSSR